MPKRHTSKVRRRSRANVLEVRVMSPRIAWFGFLRVFGSVVKLACVLAVLAAAGWGVWRGIQRAFYENPDFRLQVIDLNPNAAIDEAGLVEKTGLDLTASLFEIDIEKLAASLRGLPEIADARAERHLPGTLRVRVTPREPKAWIASPASGLPAERRVGGLLVDAGGMAYPCPELQFEAAARLPVIELPAADPPIVISEKVRQPELARCFRLLDAAAAEDAEAVHWIESIRQANDWSLLLVTRQGTSAIFGLGDHPRQIASLRAALDHASRKGYLIATINLIPKSNIPITLQDGSEPLRAIPVEEPQPVEIRQDRRSRDLNILLNRG